MDCPICNQPMTQEEVLTERTTSPLEEDQFTTMWWCDNCEESQPLEEGENYEE